MKPKLMSTFLIVEYSLKKKLVVTKMQDEANSNVKIRNQFYEVRKLLW